MGSPSAVFPGTGAGRCAPGERGSTGAFAARAGRALAGRAVRAGAASTERNMAMQGLACRLKKRVVVDMPFTESLLLKSRSGRYFRKPNFFIL